MFSQGPEFTGSHLVQQVLLLIENGSEGTVGERHPICGELHHHAASVTGIGLSPDEAELLEAVEAVGHSAGGELHQPRQLRRRGRVIGASASQRCQHIQIAFVAETVGGGDGIEPGLYELAAAENTSHNLDRFHVEIGTLAIPCLNGFAHNIAHLPDDNCGKSYLQTSFISSIFSASNRLVCEGSTK